MNVTDNTIRNTEINNAIFDELINGNMSDMFIIIIRAQALCDLIENRYIITEEEAIRNAIAFLILRFQRDGYIPNAETNRDQENNRRHLCWLKELLEAMLTRIRGQIDVLIPGLTDERRRQIIGSVNNLLYQICSYSGVNKPCVLRPGSPCNSTGGKQRKSRKPRKSGKKQKSKKLRKSKKHSKK
jgi:hypothetical protein